MAATDVGVLRTDAMDQALGEQEIQRPVNGRRRWPPAVTCQLLEDLVGAARTMAAPDQFEYPAPSWGQAQSLLSAVALGAVERLPDAMAMIVAEVIESLTTHRARSA